MGQNDVQLTDVSTTGDGVVMKTAPPPKPKHWCLRSACGWSNCCCSPVCCLVWPVIAFVFVLIVMAIGSAVEQAAMADAPSTAWVYETDEVCSVTNETYPDVDVCHDDGQEVRHCGSCGKCSNEHDIQIYNDTLQTLTVRRPASCASRPPAPSHPRAALVTGRRTRRRCAR